MPPIVFWWILPIKRLEGEYLEGYTHSFALLLHIEGSVQEEIHFLTHPGGDTLFLVIF